MTDILTFTAGAVTYTLDLSFANANASSGTVTAISGSIGVGVGLVPITGIDKTYDDADSKLNATSPYVDSNGISFDAGGEEYNLSYTPAGGYVLYSSVPGSKAQPVTNLSLQVCFVEGTRIATEQGWTAVERLEVGDLVRTSSGALRPVKWTGHRTIDCAQAPHPSVVLPVLVAAHAFGPERPMRDLYLSPAHAVCIDMLGEVLAPISSLLNGATIRQVDVEKVAYWHVELDSHDILLAENLPAESYLEVSNRAFFVESDLVDLDPRPDAAIRTTADFCRPFHVDGVVIEAARVQLCARAKAMGWRMEPRADLHLLANGVRIEPSINGHAVTFARPDGDFWLVCETTRPCDVGPSRDRRDLGVAISQLSCGDKTIDLADPRLNLGFYPLEAEHIRWTGRRALLKAELFADAADGGRLEVQMAADPLPRWIAPEAGAARQVA